MIPSHVRLSRRESLSLRDFGAERLESLCRAIGASSPLSQRAVELFDLLVEPWDGWPTGHAPPWPNDICDDGSPFEFSLAFDGGRPHIRMLMEPQRAPITERSSWEAGLATHRRLRETGWADPSMFERIGELFEPPKGHHAHFSLWHAAVVEPEGHLFKAYVNPQIRGASEAPRLLEEALRRLDMSEAWEHVAPHVSGEHCGSVRYLSVDLTAPAAARVKVYLARSESAVEVERLMEGAARVRPGDALAWLEYLAGTAGPFEARPILTCLSFQQGRAQPEATVHVPIRCYQPDDAEALQRAEELLGDQDARRLRLAVWALARRPLTDGSGLLTYASVRRGQKGLRLTVYLSPELYAGSASREELEQTGSG